METPLASQMWMQAENSSFFLGSKISCYIASYIMMSEHFRLLLCKQKKLHFSSRQTDSHR